MKILSRILIISLIITVGKIVSWRTNLPFKVKLKQGFTKGAFSPITPAFATTLLDPATLYSQLGTEAGRANFSRFLYYLVNGAGTGYSISGPSGGYVGVINDITGPNALGEGLTSNGIESCSQIPDTGNATLTEEDGSVYLMEFSPPVGKSVPSHFPYNPSESFDNHLTVRLNGTHFMTAEFKCTSSIQTGYIRFTDSTNSLDFETYFQMSGNLVYIDFFMVSSADSTKVANRFYTLNGQSYSLYLVRYGNTGNSTSMGVSGDTASTLARLKMIDDSTHSDTTDITLASLSDCLELSSNTSVSSCVSSGISLASPGTFNLGSGATNFDVLSIKNMSLSSL
ncbi:MAG: hypothetical protein HOE90_13820 [Bacteriovoracaceae bacterium]|jgi:hypothetical protein|nr:hypothetical protein [Bacteriovoracaceae bacterium]